MSKRILLAEASDTIRGVATTVLRQNGIDVISVGTAQKAMEVLNHTHPNLLIVGGTLADRSGSLFYERVSADHRFASTPMLLFAEPGQPQLPFPSEVVINLPFDPKEFVDRVNAYTGQSQAPPATPQSPSTGTANPLAGAGLEDGAIDAALGLDRIEVTGSEVMDKTRTGKLKVPEKMIGYDHVDNTDTDLTDSSRVESIMIHDESADIAPAKNSHSVPPDPTASGKLDILDASDQYSMSNPDQLGPGATDRTHDYEWFINEMQQEAKSQPPVDTSSAPQQPELTTAKPSSFVDPITPPPDSPAGAQPPSSGEAVEKFIDEFKKEVEKIHDSEPESILLEADQPSASSTDADHDWENSLEKVAPDRVEWFTKEFVNTLAERIAVKIAAKIDGEKLLALLKTEIMAQAARKKQGQA